MELVSREMVLYCVAIDIFNRGHKKFNLTFADHDEQEELAELVKRRYLLRNCLADEDASFDVPIDNCPRPKKSREADVPDSSDSDDSNDEDSDDEESEVNVNDYEYFTLEDLEQMRGDLPQFKGDMDDLIKALNNLGLGTYRWNRAASYIGHLR